jgi:hypothetical protein
MSDPGRSAKSAAILRYFEQSDAGTFPSELFTEDFQFFLAKFGVGHGVDAFVEMAAKAGVRQFKHDPAKLLLIEDRDHVAVEGLTEGVTSDGVAWRGGRTPAGRFASVFSFNREGLIERMHIYLDPDFAGAHTAGFKWDRGAAQEW